MHDCRTLGRTGEFIQIRLGKWVESGDPSWRNSTSDEHEAPTGLDACTNKLAEADDCDTPCILTLKDPINLSQCSSATLDRFADGFINTGDYLKVEVYGNGTWAQLFKGSDGNGDTDRWESKSVDLASYSSTDFKLRFTALADRIAEDFGVDNVKITGKC